MPKQIVFYKSSHPCFFCLNLHNPKLIGRQIITTVKIKLKCAKVVQKRNTLKVFYSWYFKYLKILEYFVLLLKYFLKMKYLVLYLSIWGCRYSDTFTQYRRPVFCPSLLWGMFYTKSRAIHKLCFVDHVFICCVQRK